MSEAVKTVWIDKAHLLFKAIEAEPDLTREEYCEVLMDLLATLEEKLESIDEMSDDLLGFDGIEVVE